MNFEDLVNKSKSVKAPDLKVESAVGIPTDSKDKTIIGQLKLVDAKARWGIRAIQILYVFLILILLSILFYSNKSEIRLGIGFISAAFLLVIFIQQLRYAKYNYSYANSPVKEFLNDAKKRMRVFTPRTWLVIPIWIFIDIGLCFILSEIYPFGQHIPLIIILLQVILLLAIVFDFYSSYLYWKKEHQPVIAEIDKMLEEIEN